MVKLGVAHSVLDSETVQVEDLFDGELYQVRCNAINVAEIKEKLEDTSADILIEFDDDTMEMID